MTEKLESMPDSMFDLLMEIRQVDKQISDQRLKVQKSQNKLSNLERKINEAKDLQFKASIILNETERISEATSKQLNNIHETYDSFIEMLGEKFEIIAGGQPEHSADDLEKMKIQRDDLKNKLLNARKGRENLAMRLNETELQVAIQKKRNAAMLLRLQKNLEESLQEEKYLMDKLKSTNYV